MHFLVGTVKSISWWFNSGKSEWDHSSFEWLGTPSGWEFSRMQCNAMSNAHVPVCINASMYPYAVYEPLPKSILAAGGMKSTEGGRKAGRGE